MDGGIISSNRREANFIFLTRHSLYRKQVLSTADQFVGFHMLRSSTVDYDGITIRLDCDVIINQGTSEEIKSKGSLNYPWKEISSSYLFKGTFDGQGHTISGIYMQLDASAVKAMFGGIGKNATLKDFNLINSYFGGPTAEDKVGMGAIVAKVAGEDASVTLSGITVNAILESGKAELSRVGGIIGLVTEGVTVNIDNCIFKGSSATVIQKTALSNRYIKKN